MIFRNLITAGAILGLLSVGFGAFGAHALKSTLIETGRTETFELAVRYQFYHSLALLAMASLSEKLRSGRLSWSALLITGGTIIFSGSLYTLSLTGKTIWGAVTPVGGALLIAGWALLITSPKKLGT